MHLGTKIKFARIAKGLSQQELASKIKKKRPLISHIEQSGKVSKVTLEQICSALDKSVEELEAIEYPVSGKLKPRTIKDMLEEEITLLQNENKTLKELVKSQKEIIAMLKEKIGTTPKKGGKNDQTETPEVS